MLLSRSLLHFRPQKFRAFAQLTRIANLTTQTSPDTGANRWQPFNAQTSDSTDYNASMIAMLKKRKLDARRWAKNKKTIQPNTHQREGTNEEVLTIEAEELLSKLSIGPAAKQPSGEAKDGVENEGQPKSSALDLSIQLFSEYEVEIIDLSSTGDGLGYSPSKDQILVVPFTTPGDTVIARPYKEVGIYIHSDFVKLVKPSAQREGITPGCKYFSECSGCQLQMISYEDQLKHKKTIVEKAFKYFSGLSPDKIPAVIDTMGSPLQYGYRTKLTPHFSLPRNVSKTGRPLTEAPPIGFNKKGKNAVLDIEHCPIGTEILQEGITLERARVKENISKYKNGATILLRESTRRLPNGGSSEQNGESSVALDFISPPVSAELTHTTDGSPEFHVTYSTHSDYKTYTSNEVGMTTEYIGPYKFTNKAGSFFQNNNSILRPFTSYIYDNCIPKPTTTSAPASEDQPIKYLLDAYCGSGLFTITLSPIFSSALGIDIDRRGIEAARLNAEANSIPNAGFIEADATDLFGDVPFPPDQSLVVIDPPRKGASADFLKQLCQFGPKRVIYVSCNVHTQARDVGMIVEGFGEGKGWRYDIESLRGFDFFPQTGHVEGVCVLNRAEKL